MYNKNYTCTEEYPTLGRPYQGGHLVLSILYNQIRK